MWVLHDQVIRYDVKNFGNWLQIVPTQQDLALKPATTYNRHSASWKEAPLFPQAPALKITKRIMHLLPQGNIVEKLLPHWFKVEHFVLSFQSGIAQIVNTPTGQVMPRAVIAPEQLPPTTQETT